MLPYHRPENPGRFERKFVIADSTVKEVEAQLMLHPALFRGIHEPRSVNNIYLDSLEFSHFFDNVEGNARRRKVRIRWYGSLEGTARSPKLEIKEKSGHIGWKQSFSIPDFDFDEQFDTKNLQAVIGSAELPPALRQDLQTLRPALVNRYHRKYLLSWDRLFRVTLDDQLAYFGINNLASRFSFPKRNDEEVILELKYQEAHDDAARQITNAFHWRLGKNSKYVSGLMALMDI
jgi:hypothetical protein